MNKVFKMVKLDFVSNKPYITKKNLIIFFALAIYFAFIYKRADAVFFAAPTILFLYGYNPFLAGMESGLDSLYRLGGFSSRTVVRGRLLYLVSVDLVITLISSLCALILTFFLPAGQQGATILFAALSSFFLAPLPVILSYPFLFKFGYSKGKSYMLILPLILFGLGVGLFLSNPVRSGVQGFFRQGFWTWTVLVLLYLAFWLAVYLLSQRWYQKREF